MLQQVRAGLVGEAVHNFLAFILARPIQPRDGNRFNPETMTAVPTIFALSSGRGRAGVAVIRVSGPAAALSIQSLASPLAEPRRAVLRRIKDPQTLEVLDDALVIFFAAPKTETGEDMAEFHVHGGGAIITGVLEALGRIPGCRLAEPGEFTKRAFYNGKIDLAQAEGLADLVEAETSAQRRQALLQAGGKLSALYDGWRERLIGAAALVEAAIDFSDEADIAANTFQTSVPLVEALRADIGKHLNDGRRGEILRDGFRVVLAGAPNVGKSSLLNALARREAAIVSDEPGTTRDVIEIKLNLRGLPVIISDTAGIRASGAAAIEREGMKRSRAEIAAADLVLWLTEPGIPSKPDEAARASSAETIVLLNKADKISSSDWPGISQGRPEPVSVKTGQGLPEFIDWLAIKVAKRTSDGESLAVTQVRHRTLLEHAAEHLDRFLAAQSDGLSDAELRAEDLRLAAQALGRITGRIDPEDVLDAVFGRFCIGK